MTCVGDSGELGENARVPGANFIKLDVGDGLQAPIDTLSVRKCLGVSKELK